MHWAVAVVGLLGTALTIRRGWFKFPPPVPPITRADFPEGFWALVAFLIAFTIFAAYLNF